MERTTPIKPRTSISFGENEAESAESAGTPGSGFRSSIHIVPGGAHDTWGGFSDTQVSPASQKFHSSFRTMTVKAEASPAATTPKGAPKSTTAAAFVPPALPMPASAVEPLGSQITVMEEGLTGSREGELAPPKPVSAMKARDLMATNVLCGEERPNMDEPQPAVPLRAVPADAKAVAGMTVAELRIALRERGLSPAGARATLVERLLAGLEAGAAPVMVPLHEHSSGIGSSALSAAYARADGQVEGPPVHRGAGPPPPSHELQALLEGDASGPPPPPPPPLSDAARAMQASHIQILGDAPPEADEDSAGRRADPRRVADLAGQGIFTPAAIESAPWSALKAKDYKGSGIFDEAAPAPSTRLDGFTARHLPAKREELGGHIALQNGFAVGTAETTPAPAIGLSTAKSTELSGNDIIGLAAAPLPQPQPWSAFKSAELDSSVFAEQFAAENAGGGSARKSPGVPSPPTAAARARDYGSTLFTEEFTGPQPRKEPSPSLAKHVVDLYSKNSAEGCTMAYSAPTAAPADAATPPPVAGKARRSSGGGVSSVVFG